MNVGDTVRLTKDIWDDGCDNHHPPGYLARKGEILVVRSIEQGRTWVGVSHANRPDGWFNVYNGEYEIV